LGSNQLYINGFSTSLPESTQLEALRNIEAFKNIKLIRPGYAIEYDYFPARQLKSTLESKSIDGLYLAGQINGTSGYEEAAAQGLLAGANAALKLKAKKPLLLAREESYIGVLIDDIITKHINEPYRMFTSRAEHRLNLRPDNVYRRLSKKASLCGLLTNDQASLANKKLKDFEKLTGILSSSKIKLDGQTISAKNYLKRPENTLEKNKQLASLIDSFDHDTVFQVETEIKYEGYVEIELQRIKKQAKIENTKIPPSTDYKIIEGLSSEAIERLGAVKPETLGQASRVGGVRPSDVVIISVFLEKRA
jgi:tRNA uridine 5-carboxymethylaminomethyl modification enzyme